MLELIVKLPAAKDITDVQDWYNERQSGLGDKFRRALDALFERLLDGPSRYPKYTERVRRAAVTGFP
jgi:ParE toxin of type II toxin-antitoxin system, parDE